MQQAVKAITPEALLAKVGQEVGVSDWFVIDQQRIDAFAAVTEDRQFIHVDPQRAKETPWGQTIAHGFLTLSLTAAMNEQALPRLAGMKMSMNYGYNKLRFLSPVLSGKRVRGRYKLLKVDVQPGDRYLITHEISVEIEGEAKPALVAEWLILSFL